MIQDLGVTRLLLASVNLPRCIASIDFLFCAPARAFACHRHSELTLFANPLFTLEHKMIYRTRPGTISPLLPLSVLVTSLLMQTALAAVLSVSVSSSEAFSAVSSTAVTDISSATVVAGPTAAAQAKQPNGDPCGPSVQDNPNYPNTCNLTPILADSPNPYSINCTHTMDIEKYPTQGVMWDNCAASIKSICTKMEDSRTVTGMWIASMLANNCALKFYLPPFDGSAPRPSGQRCVNIFTAMVASCRSTTVPSNYASVNMRALPTFDPSYWDDGKFDQELKWVGENATGEAVNVGYPSYVVSQSISGQ